MTDDLLSLRVLFVSAAPADQELFRRAASASRIPIEVIEADGVASAGPSLAAGVDVAFLDDALGDDAIEKVTTGARGGQAALHSADVGTKHKASFSDGRAHNQAFRDGRGQVARRQGSSGPAA